MITIKVDEGYAYDYLAILDVKRQKGVASSEKNFKISFSHIENQVGVDLHNQIYNSNEYLKLTTVNSETFDAVERARYGSISAKEVDELNMKRYHCKIALQNKFFSSEVLEQKT